MRDGEPWFVLSDVCRVLEIGNPSDVARRLDEDEVCALALGEGGSSDGLDTIEGIADPRVHTLILVSAPGLYGLITTSRKTSARKFRRWVTHKVLPSIQRTGSYTVGRPEEPRDVRLARHLVEAHEVIAEHRGQIAVLTAEKAAIAETADQRLRRAWKAEAGIVTGTVARGAPAT